MFHPPGKLKFRPEHQLDHAQGQSGQSELAHEAITSQLAGNHQIGRERRTKENIKKSEHLILHQKSLFV